jgi:UDP-N-acetylmuramate dehydrogenase
MNAGAYGSDTSEVLSWAEVYKPETGAVERVPNARARALLPPQRAARVPGLGSLARGVRVGERGARRAKGSHKGVPHSAHERLPEPPELRLDLQAAGGRLSGACHRGGGPQGTRVGQIEVSPVHANYFVNHGGGTARDALELIEHVRETVVERLGIELELEVKILGEP